MFFSKPKGVFDRLIVGLGNIGAKYDGTRHNVGFACIDELEKKYQFKPYKEKFRALITECEIKGERCLIAKPTTFMNLSGESVSEIVKFYKIPMQKVIVFSDDIDLDAGRLRIRPSGSCGGHNGLRNIIDCCQSDAFVRIRVGIGKKPHPDYDLKDWVLSCYKGEDAERIKAAISRAADAVSVIISDGCEAAMTEYNRQVQ